MKNINKYLISAVAIIITALALFIGGFYRPLPIILLLFINIYRLKKQKKTTVIDIITIVLLAVSVLVLAKGYWF